MARLKSKEVEKNAVTMAAALMAATARTAPKARGVDATASLVLDGVDLEKLATAMDHKATKKPDYLSSVFKRDANNVRKSECVLLLGVTGHPKKIEQPLDCGACGYASCEHLSKARSKLKVKDFGGPVCAFQAMDLGIALGSAVKLAAELCIDNRMMFTIGAAAKSLGLLDSDIIIGIPLSVTGKSLYFDRG
ncbi:MAG: ferredoxin domain-containing protein [Dehalococcoidales bacterium]